MGLGFSSDRYRVGGRAYRFCAPSCVHADTIGSHSDSAIHHQESQIPEQTHTLSVTGTRAAHDLYIVRYDFTGGRAEFRSLFRRLVWEADHWRTFQTKLSLEVSFGPLSLGIHRRK